MLIEFLYLTHADHQGDGAELWIGLRDLEKEGCWIWTDGSPFFYATWHAPQPDNGGNTWAHLGLGEACATVSDVSGNFNDMNCNDYTGLMRLDGTVPPAAPFVDGWLCKKIGANGLCNFDHHSDFNFFFNFFNLLAFLFINVVV